MATAENLETVLINLSRSFPGVIQLITASMTIMGMVFILIAMYQLKVYGELRTMMASNTSLKGPLSYMLAGAVMLFFGPASQAFLKTIYATSTFSPLDYQSSGSLVYQQAINVILRLVQIVGLIAFFRGWILFAQASGQGGRVHIGKALTHIFGGVIAMNVVGTRDVLWSTLGLG